MAAGQASAAATAGPDPAGTVLMAETNDRAQPPQIAVFRKRVRDAMRHGSEALAVRPGTPCADMVVRLAQAQASCAVVVNDDERPIGILTEQDIARRIACRVAGDAPVDMVMTSPVQTVERRDYLYHAIAWMRRHRLRHMPVVDRGGRLAGILYLHEALAAANEPLLEQIDLLSHEGSIAGLKQIREAQVDLAETLFAGNLPAPDIQQLLTQINNDLVRRVGELHLRRMEEEGWGALPVTACTIVMGSGGRGENYLVPDQDNGFIIGDYPDDEHGRIDTFFLELAERLCRGLDEIGIPYCNGYCMAVNPLWRKNLSQWIEQIGLWGRKSNFVAVRLADIFFDYQPVWGNRDLAALLRRKVTQMARNNHFFLKQMFQDQANHNVALGVFGGLDTERDKPGYRGQVNLKYTGTIPLVEGVRLLALREGVEATSTLERMRALHAEGALSAGDEEELTQAFHCVTELLLRRQIADKKAGRRVDYYINPKALAKHDLALLLESLRAIDSFRKRIRLEFTAQIF
jgi:signal-transduction protein with cAMP-binding, CBS, and nucleotidyltransferase domain